MSHGLRITARDYISNPLYYGCYWFIEVRYDYGDGNYYKSRFRVSGPSDLRVMLADFVDHAKSVQAT